MQGAEPGLINYRALLEYWAAGGSELAEEQLRRESSERADFEVGLRAYVDGDCSIASREFEPLHRAVRTTDARLSGEILAGEDARLIFHDQLKEGNPATSCLTSRSGSHGEPTTRR